MRRIVIAVVILTLLGCSGGGEDADPRRASFDDPNGRYRLEIDPTWDRLPGTFVAEVEAWGVARSSYGFRPNVNVLVQEFPGSSPEDYIHYSEQGAPGVDLSSSVIELDDGNAAARFEYRLEGATTSPRLQVLGIAAVGDGVAVVASLTTRPGDFDELRDEVEPYLRTLHLID